jgi:hypothetical protein
MNILNKTLFLSILTVLSSNAVLAHPTDERVSIEKDSQATVTAGKIEFTFEMVDDLKKVPVTDVDLNIGSEKILHAFFFDPALKEFRHEHPIFKDSKWTVSTDLMVNGNYWFWVQGQLKVDGADFSSKERLNVLGGASENAVEEIGDVRTAVDGVSRATLGSAIIKAKQMVMLPITFSRTKGNGTPKITPYLGEPAHLVVVSDDGDSLIHAHPMGGMSPNDMMAHLNFPEAGNYRIWLQFIDDGVLRVLPLAVQVVP